MDTAQTFKILDHLDKLEAAKGGRYICPSCQGHNLTINKQTGAYQCWNGCECRDIRDMIAPLPNRNNTSRYQPVRQKIQKLKPPVPPKGDIKLARLLAPVTDRPQPQRDFDKEHGKFFKTTYVYSLTPEGQLNRWVMRTDWVDPNKPKGRNKTFRHCHRSESGEVVWKKGDAPWEAYRIDEFVAALKATPGVAVGLVQEGEEVVEKARTDGLASTTFSGSGWSPDDLQRSLTQIKEECPTAVLAFLRDNDPTGSKKAKVFQGACDRVGIFSFIIDPVAIYSELPDKGDIVEILAAMDTPEFIRRLEEEIHKAVEAAQSADQLEDEFENIPDSLDPDIEFTQKVLSFLYGDKPWISADDKLYFWTGTYYKCSPDAVERPKIASFCNSYPVEQKDGSIRYPYAKPSKVREALQWIKDRLEVDPSLLDPPGLNCTNGVLQILWDGNKPSWQLVNHDPALYYTYEPIVTYNPNADSTNCDRLLEVLVPQERKIFLRTNAAALDLKTVRRYKGRLVRILLLSGHGSNGKDTLRECVAAMFGYRGMTSATLTDFASYDQGRKFPLARLNNSRVNWASENANTAKLDKIQSLKAFITGDPISIEGKGKDEFEFNPVGVALFNVNDTPDLQGTLEAIQSRYGILTFNKTFKIGADPSKGELEADPRFKYDPDFLRSEVLPAFLNHILDALVRLMAEGIDYSCTQQALENIQAENSHLFQFCQEVGISYNPNGILSAGEIWDQLEAWYIDNGTLTYEETSNGKKRSVWIDQARRGDANVKGANQVIARFQNLFPKAKRVTVGKGKMALQGISFSPVYPKGEPVYPAGEAVVSQLVSQKPLPGKDGEPVTPVFLVDAKKVENKPQSFEQCDQNKTQKEDRGEKLTRLAHHPATASDTASPTAPLTASPTTSTASPLSRYEEPDILGNIQPKSTPALVERTEPAGVRIHQQLDSVGTESTEAIAYSQPQPQAPAQIEALAPHPVQQPQAPASASVTETKIPSPGDVAAQILQCKAWVAVVEAVDAVSALLTGKNRSDVFALAVKHISFNDRQHLVRLLATHIQQFPRDHWAYNWLPNRKMKDKAIALAQGSIAGEESEE